MKETHHAKKNGQIKYKMVTPYDETIEGIAEDMAHLSEIRKQVWLEVHKCPPLGDPEPE